jgi:hypothetical protein
MRHLTLSCLSLMLLACQPDAGRAAIHVEVSYGFKAGCITVAASDKAAPARQARQELEVLSREPATPVSIAVFRGADWSQELVLTLTAHERSCDGPVVASARHEVSLESAGVKKVTASLDAPDVDEDGWVDATAGGRDCDDTHAGSFPGGLEVCDGRDNDCENGTDDGLPRRDYFRDADGDGAGAAATMPACEQPPGHVLSSGDCDDGDASRGPGQTEVCDGKDNNCAGGVDDGLAVSAYYRDGDGDGFGVAADTLSRCGAPAGYVTARAEGFDCDDGTASVKPGNTEVCNAVDDDCEGGVDEGLPTQWYLDGDRDGAVLKSSLVTGCTRPEGYVQEVAGFDCDDSLAEVKPGAEERCNGRDDDCDGALDERFPLKGQSCTTSGCSGTYVCDTAQTGTTCNALPPTSYYPDADGDGEGSSRASDERKVCAGETPPAGYLTHSTDCDDQDAHNQSSGSEVCDDRDNNCANGKSDEALVCGGKGWKELGDPVAKAYNWNTVALGSGGSRVWIAGDSGALAVRTSGAGAFTLITRCASTRWNAAWARPGTAQVFLAGDAGALAMYDAGSDTCTEDTTNRATGGTRSDKPLEGIIGFESGGTVSVYVVNDEGHVYTWTPGSAPAFVIRRSPSQPYRDLHATAASHLVLVGTSPSGGPLLHTYDATVTGASLVTPSPGTIPPEHTGSLWSVWVVDDARAYAVGEKGVFLKRDATGSWRFGFATAQPGMVTDLTSVVAFDDDAVYVADKNGKIRRPTPGGWVEHFSASGELKDIAAASRQDLWGVGPSGRVVHFPEP